MMTQVKDEAHALFWTFCNGPSDGVVNRPSLSFSSRDRCFCTALNLWSFHRLNGSSSPVLTATSLSYGKAKNSTPHRIKTPDLIEIKFGTVNYVGEMTPHAKFHVNPSKGGFPANGWNIRKNFCSHIPFFRNSPTGQTLRRIFARDGSNEAVWR